MANQKEKDEIVTHLVGSVPTMQTDIALLKKDIDYLTKSSDVHTKKQEEQARKSDLIIERLDKLSVISREDFDRYKKDHSAEIEKLLEKMDVRFRGIETFIDDNKPGIKLSTLLVNKWIMLLVLLLIVAAIGLDVIQALGVRPVF